MILIKYLSLIFICIVSSYIGVLKARTYDLRVKNLKKFLSSLNLLKSKIEFTHEPINIIFDEISKTIYSDNENIFKITNTLDNTFYDSWKNSIENIDCNYNKEDKEIIKTLGKQLRKNRCKRTIKYN